MHVHIIERCSIGTNLHESSGADVSTRSAANKVPNSLRQPTWVVGQARRCVVPTREALNTHVSRRSHRQQKAYETRRVLTLLSPRETSE